ncbi:helix-turn-helix domain-containing protein [Streptomyces sp. NPDC058195]|uniref:helix-turn-helix domain-containing protein n=1 Tax=Streptomyces sp. NPDC058195 TaxID=3346375 RepID=UPI0036E25B95
MRFDPHPLRVAAAARGDHTIRAIAARLHAPYPSVRRWTSGTAEPRGIALAAIERTYGVTAAALFTTDAT